MRRILLSAFILAGFFATAQEKEKEAPPQGWTSEGKFQILVNQSAFNKEWSGGGTSSVAGNFILDYNFNYRKDDFTWDNRIIGNYGITKLRGDQFTRKTSDRLEITSIAGKQLENSNWYYSFFANFRTQFSKGYVYSRDAAGQQIRKETTHFLSPAYLQFGPGMMWKQSEDFWFNLAPATARLIFVDSEFTTVPGYQDGAYFGVDRGDSSRFELGASVNAYLRFDVIENVSLENSLSLYSNYLDEPGNVDIDYLMNLEMTVNKFISASLIFQAIYDDNTVEAFQIREVFGAGLTYTF